MTTMKDFIILTKIGDGAYSEVYKVKRNSDNQIYALKKVSVDFQYNEQNSKQLGQK